MAERSDVKFRWDLSPRVIRVEDPSSEIVAQDLVDTSRDEEDEPRNLIYPSIISAAGKENLGGGVLVGITATLQNAHIAFDERAASDSSGTATSADATGFILTDTAATFETDLIAPGAWVVNFTDQSVGTVIKVIDEQNIQLFVGLSDGTDDDWGIGDVYKIWNVEQVEVSGGNVVAVDELGADISAILPTMGTQVVRTSASSATIAELLALEHATYNGGVVVDPVNGVPGTAFPIGTRGTPVDNFADALTIAAEQSLTTLFPIGLNLSVDSGLDFRGKMFRGQGESVTSLIISAPAQVEGCTFLLLELSGVLDGKVNITECTVGNLTFVDGTILNCSIEGTLTLSGSEDAHIINCWDGLPGPGVPTIDAGGTGSAINIRNYRGGISVINKTGTDGFSVDMVGRLLIDGTVTGGSLIVRGIGSIEDTGSTIAINDTGLINPALVADAVWEESNSDHTALNTKGLAVALTEYEGTIWISNNGAPGIAVGVNGTPSNPVDNLADALTLIDDTGFDKLTILSGSFTLVATLTEFVVELHNESELNLGGQNVNGTQFSGGIVKGTMTGAITMHSCNLEDIVGVVGHFVECGFKGNVALGVGESTFDRCHSEVPGSDTPTINFVGAGRTMSLRGYYGGLKVENMTDASNIATLDYGSGQLIIDSSCSAGILVVRGVVDPVTDGSTGTTVNQTGVVKGSDTSLSRKTLENRLEVDFLTQELILYDDDGTTVLRRWPLETDAGGVDLVATQAGVQTKRKPKV